MRRWVRAVVVVRYIFVASLLAAAPQQGKTIFNLMEINQARESLCLQKS